MKSDLLNRVEKIFYDYAQKYDENIKSIIKERDLAIEEKELDDILKKAKNMVNK